MLAAIDLKKNASFSRNSTRILRVISGEPDRRQKLLKTVPPSGIHLVTSHFLRLFLNISQLTLSCGPTVPIGQNVPSLSPRTPYRLTLIKFLDFDYMTGPSNDASNRLYENTEKLAIATPKSSHRVTISPDFFLRTSL